MMIIEKLTLNKAIGNGQESKIIDFFIISKPTQCYCDETEKKNKIGKAKRFCLFL